MPHIVDGQSSDAFQWKARLRERIEGNLEHILQDAQLAYSRKVAEASFSSTGVPSRLELEHRQNVQNLRRMADEELQAEIAREQWERNWALQQSTQEVDQAVIEEQLAILNQIQHSVSRMQSSRPGTYSGSIFQEEVSSHIYFSPQSLCVRSTRSGTDTEALSPAERHEKQQEEFRKRAQAIQERKRRERQASMQLDWSENISSLSSDTSLSDQETGIHTANALKEGDLDARMTEEDIVDLVTFHEQQWIFISTLPHLQWTDFPWPVLSFSRPKRLENLNVEAVVGYVCAPLTADNDRAVLKDRLKDLLRRWHPDRFETRYLSLISNPREQEMVRKGAGIVARILNDLLREWNCN